MMKKLLNIVLIVLCSLLVTYVYLSFKSNQLESNKIIVKSFLNAVINKKDFTEASQYLGENLIQHDPDVTDGAQPIKEFVQFLRNKYPEARDEIKQIYAEKDHVVVYLHSVRVPNTRGRAIVHIFRLKNKKIVEHWEVVEDIPEKSLNQHGMF